jgi:hypothetical protein
MALSLAIVGSPFDGKSFSRTYIKNGQECFVIMPSSQPSFLTTEDGKPVKGFEAVFIKGKDEVVLSDYALSSGKSLIQSLYLLSVTNIKDYQLKSCSGNYITCTLDDIEFMMRFINKYMPTIKNIFIEDMSTFITQYVTTKQFLARKDGGEAFARFADLAASTVRNVVFAPNALRNDLLIFAYYHVEKSTDNGKWNIFLPQGSQLNRSFKLESMYAYMLAAAPEFNDETGEVIQYRFATSQTGGYLARTLGHFGKLYIPNDMQLVIDTIREKEGI